MVANYYIANSQDIPSNFEDLDEFIHKLNQRQLGPWIFPDPCQMDPNDGRQQVAYEIIDDNPANRLYMNKQQ